MFSFVIVLFVFVLQIVRGKKKKTNDEPGAKGNYQIYVRTIKGVRFPINAIPSNKISQVKKKIHQKKGIPIEDQMLSFKDVPLKDEKTVCKYQHYDDAMYFIHTLVSDLLLSICSHSGDSKRRYHRSQSDYHLRTGSQGKEIHIQSHRPGRTCEGHQGYGREARGNAH